MKTISKVIIVFVISLHVLWISQLITGNEIISADNKSTTELNFILNFLLSFNPVFASTISGFIAWMVFGSLTYYNQLDMLSDMNPHEFSRLKLNRSLILFESTTVAFAFIVSFLVYRACHILQ